MRNVSRDGGSTTRRRSEKTRIVGLTATFLLLMAGFVVSAPGLMSASASNTSEVQGGDDHAGDDECENDDDQSGHDDEAENEGSGGDKSAPQEGSEGFTGAADFVSSDEGGDDEGDDEGDDDESCDAILTLVKTPDNDDGGLLEGTDFQLLLDGVAVEQGVDLSVTANVAHEISEMSQPGYQLRLVECTTAAQSEAEYEDGVVTLSPGEHAYCEVINDDIAPTITVHKTVVNDDDGTADELDFELTVNGDLVEHDSAYEVMANEPSIVSENLFPGYNATSVVCTSDIEASPNNKSEQGTGTISLTPALAENIDCTITNDDTPTIKREASLTIDKVDNVDVVGPGDVYSYMITVSNAGPSTFVAGVAMTDDLPAGLQLMSVSAGGAWTCNDTDPVACTYGDSLAAGASAPTITITVKLNSNYMENAVYNVASASAAVEPPVVDREEASPAATTSAPGAIVSASDDETTLVVREADLSIDKSVSQSTAIAGNQFNWFLAVTNHGPDTAINLSIDDTLPAQFQVLGVFPPSGVTCTSTASAVHCADASLLIDQTVTIQVQVRVVSGAAPGLVSNTGTVQADSTDPVPGNNSDTASITIGAVASEAPVPAVPGPPAVRPQLPRTGNSSLGGPLSLGGLLCGAGVLSLIIARRRRPATA
jgi:uncharacterized repeat protein (TIGR01451 family)